MAARRPGLVAKKIMVQGKLGRRHQRTYWVRPNVAQNVRLRRASNEGLFTTTSSNRPQPRQRPLQEVHPRAGLKSWFKSRGYDNLTDEQVGNLLQLFKKPDGTLISGDDFEKLYANPGKKTFSMRKLSGTQTPWGQPDTIPDRDAAGNQIVKHFDTELKVTYLDITSRRMGISLAVMGYPIFPPGHPREGERTGEPPRELSEGFSRSFSKSGDELTLEHSLFKMQPEFQGSSLGSEVIKNQFFAYEGVGVKNVHVHGEWMGQYFWGRLGFEAERSNKERINNRFESMVRSMQAGSSSIRQCDSKETRPGTEILTYPVRGKIFKEPGVPYTIEELMALHAYQGKTTSELYSTAIEIWNPTTQRKEKIQLFKEVVLSSNGGASFYGDVAIKVGAKSYENVRAYYRDKRVPFDEAAFKREEKKRLQIREEDKPLHEARTAELQAMDNAERNVRIAAEAAARQAREAEEQRVRAERRAREEAEAEARRVAQEAEARRVAPLLNPEGQPAMQSLSNLVNNRLDGTVWSPVQQLRVMDREAWVANNAGPGTATLRRQAVNAMNGMLSVQRVLAAREMARRYQAAGDEAAANNALATARTHLTEGRERARADVQRGNVDALREFERVLDRGNLAEALAYGTTSAASAPAPAAPQRTAAQAQEIAIAQPAAPRQPGAPLTAQERLSLAPEPASEPRRGSRAREIYDHHYSQLENMTPEERAASIAATSDTQNRRARQQAADEITGAAAQRRADYATLQIEALREQGLPVPPSLIRRRTNEQNAAAVLRTAERRRIEARGDAQRLQREAERETYARDMVPELDRAIAAQQARIDRERNTATPGSMAGMTARLNELHRMRSTPTPEEMRNPSGVRALLNEKTQMRQSREGEIRAAEAYSNNLRPEAADVSNDIRSAQSMVRRRLSEANGGSDSLTPGLRRLLKDASDEADRSLDTLSELDRHLERSASPIIADSERRASANSASNLSNLDGHRSTNRQMRAALELAAASDDIRLAKSYENTLSPQDRDFINRMHDGNPTLAELRDVRGTVQRIADTVQEIVRNNRDASTATGLLSRADESIDLARNRVRRATRGTREHDEAMAQLSDAMLRRESLQQLSNGGPMDDRARAVAREVLQDKQAYGAATLAAQRRLEQDAVAREAAARAEERAKIARFQAHVETQRPRAVSMLAAQEAHVEKLRIAREEAESAADSLRGAGGLIASEAKERAASAAEAYDRARNTRNDMRRLASGELTPADEAVVTRAVAALNQKEVRMAARREAEAAQRQAQEAADRARREAEKEAARQTAAREQEDSIARLAAARRAQAEEQAQATAPAAPETPARPQYATREGRGRRSNLRVRL